MKLFTCRTTKLFFLIFSLLSLAALVGGEEDDECECCIDTAKLMCRFNVEEKPQTGDFFGSAFKYFRDITSPDECDEEAGKTMENLMKQGLSLTADNAAGIFWSKDVGQAWDNPKRTRDAMAFLRPKSTFRALGRMTGAMFAASIGIDIVSGLIFGGGEDQAAKQRREMFELFNEGLKCLDKRIDKLEEDLNELEEMIDATIDVVGPLQNIRGKLRDIRSHQLSTKQETLFCIAYPKYKETNQWIFGQDEDVCPKCKWSATDDTYLRTCLHGEWFGYWASGGNHAYATQVREFWNQAEDLANIAASNPGSLMDLRVDYARKVLDIFTTVGYSLVTDSLLAREWANSLPDEVEKEHALNEFAMLFDPFSEVRTAIRGMQHVWVDWRGAQNCASDRLHNEGPFDFKCEISTVSGIRKQIDFCEPPVNVVPESSIRWELQSSAVKYLPHCVRCKSKSEIVDSYNDQLPFNHEVKDKFGYEDCVNPSGKTFSGYLKEKSYCWKQRPQALNGPGPTFQWETKCASAPTYTLCDDSDDSEDYKIGFVTVHMDHFDDKLDELEDVLEGFKEIEFFTAADSVVNNRQEDDLSGRREHLNDWIGQLDLRLRTEKIANVYKRCPIAQKLGDLYEASPPCSADLKETRMPLLNFKHSFYTQHGNQNIIEDQVFEFDLPQLGAKIKLTKWTHIRDYHQGFLTTGNEPAWAEVTGLEPRRSYKFALYQYLGSNEDLASQGASQVTVYGDESEEYITDLVYRRVSPTLEGETQADQHGRIKFKFEKEGLRAVLSGLSIWKPCTDRCLGIYEETPCWAVQGCMWKTETSECIHIPGDQQSNSGGGSWGGVCRCPSGGEYWVGHVPNSGCTALACEGGEMVSCNNEAGTWSNRSVTCAPRPGVSTKAVVQGVTCGAGVQDCGMAVSDGNHAQDTWSSSPRGIVQSCTSGALYVQLDLGAPTLVDRVVLWHNYEDGRRYCGQKVALSSDGNSWTTVYNTGNAYGDVESSSGKTISFTPTLARYVRHYSKRSNENVHVHFLEIDVYEWKEDHAEIDGKRIELRTDGEARCREGGLYLKNFQQCSNAATELGLNVNLVNEVPRSYKNVCGCSYNPETGTVKWNSFRHSCFCNGECCPEGEETCAYGDNSKYGVPHMAKQDLDGVDWQPICFWSETDTALGGYYTIQQKVNNRYLDAHESGGFGAVTRTAQGNDSQKWKLTAVGNYYTIQQKVNNRYLDAHEDNSNDFEAVTRTAQGNDSQLWLLTKVGNYYTIQQKVNNRYLDAHESGGFGAVTRTAQGNDSQKWKLTYVAGGSGRRLEDQLQDAPLAANAVMPSMAERLGNVKTIEQFCEFAAGDSICDSNCADIDALLDEHLPEGMLDVCEGTDLSIGDVCPQRC